MEDQAVHVVGDVGEGQFRLGLGEANRADEQAEAGLLMAKTFSIRARMKDFFALARAVACGIGLPAGLRRWMRLASIFGASHFSLFCER